MARPVFYGWYFVCPVCGCAAFEDDHACLSCGEPFDWSEEQQGEKAEQREAEP